MKLPAYLGDTYSRANECECELTVGLNRTDIVTLITNYEILLNTTNSIAIYHNYSIVS